MPAVLIDQSDRPLVARPSKPGSLECCYLYTQVGGFRGTCIQAFFISSTVLIMWTAQNAEQCYAVSCEVDSMAIVLVKADATQLLHRNFAEAFAL